MKFRVPSANKYRVAPREQRTDASGVVYDSKREMEYAAMLDLRKRLGDIRDWQRQIAFPLNVNGVRLGRHLVDFKIVEKDGTVSYVEVKGFDTPLGRWKRQQCEAEYSIKIEVVK